MVLYIHVEDGDKIGTGLTHPHTLYHTNPLIAVMMLMIFMDMMMLMIFMDVMMVMFFIDMCHLPKWYTFRFGMVLEFCGNF